MPHSLRPAVMPDGIARCVQPQREQRKYSPARIASVSVTSGMAPVGYIAFVRSAMSASVSDAKYSISSRCTKMYPPPTLRRKMRSVA